MFVESYVTQHPDGFIRILYTFGFLYYREKEWLLMPNNTVSSGALGDQTLVQWPLFLLANKVCVRETSHLYFYFCLKFDHVNFTLSEVWMVKILIVILLLHGQIYVGIDIVSKEIRQSNERYQVELWERVKRDDRYLEYAVQEAYATLQTVLMDLLNEHGRAWWVVAFSCTVFLVFLVVCFRYEAEAGLNWCDTLK